MESPFQAALQTLSRNGPQFHCPGQLPRSRGRVGWSVAAGRRDTETRKQEQNLINCSDASGAAPRQARNVAAGSESEETKLLNFIVKKTLPARRW